MKEIKFELIEKSKANKVYLLVKFGGGDADTEHPQEYLLKGTFDEVNNKNPMVLALIQKELAQFAILKELLHNVDIEYGDVLKDHGEEIAKLYEDAPNDPDSDYQFKCYINSISLIGYDYKGNKYKSNLS